MHDLHGLRNGETVIHLSSPLPIPEHVIAFMVNTYCLDKIFINDVRFIPSEEYVDKELMEKNRQRILKELKEKETLIKMNEYTHKNLEIAYK